MTQLLFQNLDAAKKAAIRLSKEGEKYSCIILSKGSYYVEDDAPFIRINEKLISQFENGKQIK